MIHGSNKSENQKETTNSTLNSQPSTTPTAQHPKGISTEKWALRPFEIYWRRHILDNQERARSWCSIAREAKRPADRRSMPLLSQRPNLELRTPTPILFQPASCARARRFLFPWRRCAGGLGSASTAAARAAAGSGGGTAAARSAG